jgi:hypothetical protein
MKTLSKFGLLLALAGSLFMTSCEGSYYVSSQPMDDGVYVQPASPYAGAVWIEGDWVWSGGRYIHSPGRWVRPRAGHTYVRGSWVHTGRGYRWHRGHWG